MAGAKLLISAMHCMISADDISCDNGHVAFDGVRCTVYWFSRVLSVSSVNPILNVSFKKKKLKSKFRYIVKMPLFVVDSVFICGEKISRKTL